MDHQRPITLFSDGLLPKKAPIARRLANDWSDLADSRYSCVCDLVTTLWQSRYITNCPKGSRVSCYETLSLFAERGVADLFVVGRLIHFAAEAIDQWFETFQNYEVTLVSTRASLSAPRLLMISIYLIV